MSKLLGDLDQFQAERAVDLLVFTGDLAHTGTIDDLSLGKHLLLEPVMQALHLDADRVVLVPGNHDIDRGGIDPIYEEGLKRLLIDREAVNRLLERPDRVAAATARLAAWQQFTDTFYNGLTRDVVAPMAWTRCLTIDGVTFGIAALNSAWRSTGSGEADRGSLLLGERQVRAALDMVADSAVRLVAVHHPLPWLMPFDSDDARRELERSGAIVLSGHEHMPDPSMSVTPRGSAVYGRAGCLYETRQYANGYAVIDIDVPDSGLVFSVRSWVAERQDFDAAVKLAENGVVRLPLPHRAGEAIGPSVPYSQVTRGLVDIVQRSAVVADILPAAQLAASVTELLVAPRLYSLPFSEVVAITATDKAKKVERLDPLKMIAEHRVIIVSGDHESGVTGALVWLLERKYSTDGAYFPLYALHSTRQGLKVIDQDLRESGARVGLALGADTALPRAIIAIDDLTADPSRPLVRLVRHMNENPDNIYILGCHGDQHQRLWTALDEQGVKAYRCFIAPFGRRELKQLVTKIAGVSARDMPDQILQIIEDKGLPRSPFMMATLAAVMANKSETVLLNATAILDAYINLMLGRLEFPGLEYMDFRGREHLLEYVAGELTRKGQQRLDRLSAEQLVLDYFQRREMRGASVGRVIDDLIRRRVLTEDGAGVGFRHVTLQHLFAAKLMADDEAFDSEMRSTPLEHPQVIAHAAALSRSDRELLAKIGAVVAPFIGRWTADMTQSRVSALLAEGHVGPPPDADHLKQLLKRTEPISNSELDAKLDEMYERLGSRETTPGPPKPLADYDDIELVWESVELLSAVLVASELVPDIELRVDLLKEAIRGWSTAAVALAKREEEEGTIRAILETALGRPLDEEGRARFDRFVRLIVMLVIVFQVVENLGNRQIQGLLVKVFDDKQFMGSAIQALLSTFLACVIKAPGWPGRLVELHRIHGGHRFVADLVQDLAMNMYQSPTTADQEAATLKTFLMSQVVSRSPTKKGVEARQALLSQVDAELNQSRIRARLKGLSVDMLGGHEDLLVEAEETPVDTEAHEAQ